MDAAPGYPPNCYRISDLVLNSGTRRVVRGNKTLKLGALTFDLLLVLAEAAPSLVTYDQLAERVWKGRSTSPETIAQRAKMLRDALSDDAKAPRYFELIRGQGYRLLVDAEPLAEQPVSPTPKRRIAIAAVVVVAALVWFVNANLPVDDKPPSVAVLPFADLSPLGDQQYLADGIAEELIRELSNLEGLDVASRTESFFYQGPAEDLQEIGRKLAVSAVLEGSVRKSEDEIRITVQLIEVESGFHLWSENFDREMQDIFAIQEDIASSVAGALGVTLGVGGVNEFRGAGTQSFDAYEAFLQGDFEKAMQLDPNYAAAWAGQGIRIASTMWRNPPEQASDIIERAYSHVAKAIELDPLSGSAHTHFATLIYATMDWERAEQSYATSLSLRRDTSSLGHYSNMFMRAGRNQEALLLREERAALLRVPETPHIFEVYTDLILGRVTAAKEKIPNLPDGLREQAALLFVLNYGSVADLAAVMQAMPPNTVEYRELYTPLVELLDAPEAVLELVLEVADDSTMVWPSKYNDLALIAAFYGDPDLAFEIFSREIHYTTIRFATLWYPVMSEVRRLPAFKEFVVDVNLVQYWRDHGWSDFCRPIGLEDFICE